ncbi:MAG TPA: intradiol ring-cleavage dioxygenase [Ktedonobacterales bacterium]|nr:intradiol ring-cleavage dioxygenase [Ktedonobacterales bacterium]
MHPHEEPAKPDIARNLSGEKLTETVLASFSHCTSERLGEILVGLVKHLHAFVSEVGLTEAEWASGIDFVTCVGHMTNDRRQEFILLSDVLGVSMQVIGINNQRPPGVTESTVFGPFFTANSPRFANGDDIANGAPGEPCFMEGQVRSIQGAPIPNAHIEVWQADDLGHYDVQYDDLSVARGRGHLYSDGDGRYYFWSLRPTAYPIPDDGPVGELLSAANRSPMRPAHVHFMITAPGYHPLITHVFAEGDPYLDTDAVFGVKTSLITPFERHTAGIAPDGRRMDAPFWTMRYDFVLAPIGAIAADRADAE